VILKAAPGSDGRAGAMYIIDRSNGRVLRDDGAGIDATGD
jgi:hypothetical protein